MLPEKHEDVIKEVLEEIETALKDKRGLLPHQRRLAFSLSLGATTLLESYFHKQNIIKTGAKINHLWFRKKADNVLEQLQKQLVSPISSVRNINAAVDLTVKIEERRDDLAYGAPASEKLLQEKINLFFKLKELLK